MATVLNIARHEVDLSSGAQIEPGHVKTGVDVTGDAFNASLVAHHLLYVLPDSYVTPGSTPTPWSPPNHYVIVGDTAAHLTSTNPILSNTQICIETDTGRQKLGDNSTHWNSLPYTGVGSIDGGTP